MPPAQSVGRHSLNVGGFTHLPVLGRAQEQGYFLRFCAPTLFVPLASFPHTPSSCTAPASATRTAPYAAAQTIPSSRSSHRFVRSQSSRFRFYIATEHAQEDPKWKCQRSDSSSSSTPSQQRPGVDVVFSGIGRTTQAQTTSHQLGHRYRPGAAYTCGRRNRKSSPYTRPTTSTYRHAALTIRSTVLCGCEAGQITPLAEHAPRHHIPFIRISTVLLPHVQRQEQSCRGESGRIRRTCMDSGRQ